MQQLENELTPDIRWRQWVTTHPVAASALAGFIAVQITTLVGYYFIGVGLPQLPWPLYNGVLGLLDTQFKQFNTTGAFFVGQSLHMINGIVFAILFALLAHSKLPPRGSDTFANLGKGLVYSVILGIISMGFLVPYVYAPKQGYGFFSFYSPNTWKLPLAILIWHLCYGFFLGLLYNPEYRSNRT
jgi:hypothetical protein